MDLCSICLDITENFKPFNCNHQYHRKCIRDWFKYHDNDTEFKCALCKSPLAFSFSYIYFADVLIKILFNFCIVFILTLLFFSLFFYHYIIQSNIQSNIHTIQNEQTYYDFYD